jgi:chorismate mutase
MEQATQKAFNLDAVFNKRPLIISGPCSAETEEQLIQTATRLAATGKIDMLRAGIWKPRTRPGSFEGVGTKGLPWLQSAKKITGLPVTVEVATGKQVEDALHFGVDVLWIGARTTVNPFSVQEVADALRGVKVPVLIKNPINPDLELWVGAMERVANAGIEQIGLIHRGFSSYGNTEYRNAPMWHLAIEMKRRYPNTLMINDPSHICGRRDILLEVAQTAIDLDFDGLIVESHIDPDMAWSDAKQQITPFVYYELCQKLIMRRETSDNASFLEHIENIRHKIDEVDLELMNLLARRMRLAEDIGRYKKRNNIAILQAARWNEILEKAYKQGRERGLTDPFVEKFLTAVHQESIAHQTRIMQEENDATKV